MEPSADKPPALPSPPCPAGAGEGAALVLDHLRRALADWPKVTALRVAFSGGLDSSVLLHALVQLARCEKLPPVYAIHIAHGLQAQARNWPLHCQKFCDALGVPLEVIRVEVDKTSASLERAAREARHGAFAERLKKGELLLLAQHQDDQAETLLLRLARGAGVRGLAGMPKARVLGQGHLLRPLLGCPRALLESYAKAQGLSWIEDPSNEDTRFARNHLRHESTGQPPARPLRVRAATCAKRKNCWMNWLKTTLPPPAQPAPYLGCRCLHSNSRRFLRCLRRASATRCGIFSRP